MSETERHPRPGDSLSVIVPVSERFDDTEALYRQYREALAQVAPEALFVYVLDGDFPDVEADLRRLIERGERLRLVRLGRWFGEATAMSVGFRETDSDWLLLLPAYHQVEPASLPLLFDNWQGEDMLVCRRWPRRDSWFNQWQTRLFHRLLHFASGSRAFHDLGCSVRLLSRRVVGEVQIYGDQHRFFPLLAERHGFRIREIDLPQSEEDLYRRLYRPGVYLRRMLDMLSVFFLLKFTKKPLRFFGLIGSGFITFGGVWLAALLAQRAFFGVPLADRPALLVSAFAIVLGVQVFSLGLLGELIIFTHAKDMKEYVIDEIVGGEEASSPEAEKEAVNR